LGGVSNPAWMTQNEIRAIDNLNPIEGGDILYSPSMNGQGAQPLSSEIPATTDTNGNNNNDSNNDDNNDSNNQPNDSQNGTNI
jgi:hypothetical protein